MKKNILLYMVMLLVFGAGSWYIMRAGSYPLPSQAVSEKGIEPRIHPSPSLQSNDVRTESESLSGSLKEKLHGPLSILLLQIIIIILAARVVGDLFVKIGQPAVIGEMIAGILLGPSVLGFFSPATMGFLFPSSSMEILKLLSQIGVIIFMFIVGMEINTRYLREKAQAAIIISHASILVPFFLGAVLSLFIYPYLSDPNIAFNSFALFIGTAMSITAFPVLARIIEERGLSKSSLGSIAIACAAVDDATAWCMLAVVVALARANALATTVLTITLALLFTGLMLTVLKPWFERLIKNDGENGMRSRGWMACLLAFVFASAWLTEIIGIHALFGAFLAGVAMPSSAEIRSFLKEKLETFNTAALLPLFFAFTGLRTQLNLLNDLQSWLLCGAVIAVAIAGKLGGSTLAARWTGMNWRDSFSIGALMNTRGLVELIVLNIGYDLGVLPARIFAVLVLMALVTTLMTGPLLSLTRLGAQPGTLLASKC